MSAFGADQVREALEGVKYPGFSRNIVSFGLVKDVRVSGEGDVAVVLEHTIDDAGVVERIRRDVQSTLEGLEGVGRIDLAMRRKDGASVSSSGGANAPQGVPGVRHIVAVASGKGGVGKSTVASNLALALRDQGLRVGVLDGDIYGPSIPTMFGVDQRPRVTEDKRIHPIEKDGLKILSIGFLVPPEKALIWRGPMVMGALQQFLRDTEWGELDVLVVDLPPGTGDAQLTLVQQVALSGAVIVTTPQDVALLDVVRGIQMFETTHAPIIGIVENMSGFVCSHCGHTEEIFGRGGGEETARRHGVPFLGAVPIDPRVVRGGDDGRPILVSHPDSPAARAFTEIAAQVVRFVQDSSPTAS